MELAPVKPNPDEGACLLVYGLPGAGKTTLAGQCENGIIMRPPADSTGSIRHPAPGLREVIAEDHNHLAEALRKLQQREWECDWFWFDTISLWEDYGLDDVFDAAVLRKSSRAEFGPDKGEYGVNRSRMWTWLRNMVGLSKAGYFNFGITAHVMDWQNPVTGKTLWTPAFGSAKTTASSKLCAYMNIVAYLSKSEKGTRMLRIDDDGFVGKDEYDCFPEMKSGKHGFTNPTMEDIQAAIASVKKPAPRTRKKTTAQTARKRAPRKRARK